MYSYEQLMKFPKRINKMGISTCEFASIQNCLLILLDNLKDIR